MRPGPSSHLQLGQRGERAAARYLKRKHHKILARNFRCPAGEIDLISVDGDTIVFVEVKSRSDDEAADPIEAVQRFQWLRIENAARYYLHRHTACEVPGRFDLVTVVWSIRGSPQIEHFPDAYQARQR